MLVVVSELFTAEFLRLPRFVRWFAFMFVYCVHLLCMSTPYFCPSVGVRGSLPVRCGMCQVDCLSPSSCLLRSLEVTVGSDLHLNPVFPFPLWVPPVAFPASSRFDAGRHHTDLNRT